MHAFARRPLLALVLLGLPALAATGRGGGSSSGGTTVSALTAAQWREQADAICKDISTRQDALPEPAGSSEVQAYLEKILPLGQEQVNRVRALVPPAELQSLQSQAIANLEEAISVVQKAIDRIKGGEDPEKVVSELTPEIERISAEGDRLASEAGLKECGDGEGSGATSTDTTGSESTDAATATESTDTETTTTGETPTVPTSGDAQVDRFLADVQKATTALSAFGDALTAVGSPDEIKAKSAELRGQLGDFDAAIAAMDGYTIDIDLVEGQRSRLVATGPKVSDVLREFVEAGSTGDFAKIAPVLPKVATAVQDFADAAQAK